MKERVDKVARGERNLNYAELRKILLRFDFELQNPKKNSIELIKLEKAKKLFGLFGERTVRKHIGSIPYPGERRDVGVDLIKRVRRQCNLTEEDGVDSDAFYFDTLVLDGFINKYRTVLRKLART